MKIYHTFDTKSQKKRIEKTNIDKYAVRLEDYESLNDLVIRSVLTKTSLKDSLDHVNGLEYDSDKEIDKFINEAYNEVFGSPDEIEVGETTAKTERSESQADIEPTEDEKAKQS